MSNGPSLKAEDLELLKNNIFLLCFKRINLIYDKTSGDRISGLHPILDYVETYLDEIKEMKGYTKLVLCAQVITRQMGIVDDAVYYPFVQMERRLTVVLCGYYA